MGDVQVGRGRARGFGEMSVQLVGEMGKASVQTFSNLFLKILTDGDVMTEAGSLFQYFITLIISIICKIEKTIMLRRYSNRYYI